MWLWIVGGVVIAVVLFWGIAVFNRLVSLRNRAENAWSDIDVQLKRRHDLVGNLVETVRQYASHERETLEAVVEARNAAEGAAEEGDASAAGIAETLLGRRIGALLAVAEDYPDLKANENFLELQRQLAELEDALQNARRYYNAVVRDFNTRIQSIPDMFIAGLAGFEERSFFELSDPSEAAVPSVSGAR